MEKTRNFDKINAVVAFGVMLTAFLIYNITKAPTSSLWDCGEFIAACNILGIPHPPGTPLYVLFGYLFSILPFSDDPAVRVNLLSVISSAIAAMLASLISVRILRPSLNDDSAMGKIILYAGSVCGAFFLAFCFTNWNNSVEAGVYGLSMMIFNAVLWLTLVYYQNRGTLFSGRILTLIIFLAFAGINAHLSTFLIIPAIIFFFILKKDADLRVWYILTGLVIFELYLIIAFSAKDGEISNFIPILIVFVFYLFYIFSFEKILPHYLIVAGGFLLSILPIINVGLTKSGISDSSMITAFGYIGNISFAVLVIYAFYLLYQ